MNQILEEDERVSEVGSSNGSFYSGTKNQERQDSFGTVADDST